MTARRWVVTHAAIKRHRLQRTGERLAGAFAAKDGVYAASIGLGWAFILPAGEHVRGLDQQEPAECALLSAAQRKRSVCCELLESVERMVWHRRPRDLRARACVCGQHGSNTD
eukprot:scaffold34109_cov73-Phaeocystis_antarctica.AAC.4